MAAKLPLVMGPSGWLQQLQAADTISGPGTFTTISGSGSATFSPANANVVLSPTGTGVVTINPATLGTINNMSMGATTASTGRFSTLTATGSITFTSGTINGISVGATTPSTGAFTSLAATGAITAHAPVTVTAVTYTVLTTDFFIIFNPTAACAVTLPAAASFSGRILNIKNTSAFAVTSASANVVPRVGGAAATALLAATAGTWACLVSDGTNWITMSGN
jgi:hypothetical protein